MKQVFGALFCIAVLLLAGCDQGQPVAKTAKVSGTVLLDGQPMPEGEVRFGVAGQPIQVMKVTSGAFSGDAVVGKNQVEVIFEKDGPPHPMDPMQKLKVNAVDPKFSGPSSVLSQDVPAGGMQDIKLEVTSAK
jgi:hypothetical protein